MVGSGCAGGCVRSARGSCSSNDSSDTGSSCPVAGFMLGQLSGGGVDWGGAVFGGVGGASSEAMLYDVLCVALDLDFGLLLSELACA